MITKQQIKPFAKLLEREQLRGLVKLGANYEANRIQCLVTVKPGKKYARVDIGNSGRYMIDLSTGGIFGIKSYGVIHRGHSYGTLDTIKKWDWSGYTALPNDVHVAVHCTDPVLGIVGTFLFRGGPWSAAGTRISPVFDALPDTYTWSKQNGFDIV